MCQRRDADSGTHRLFAAGAMSCSRFGEELFIGPAAISILSDTQALG